MTSFSKWQPTPGGTGSRISARRALLCSFRMGSSPKAVTRHMCSITLTQLQWAFPQHGLLRELQAMVARVLRTKMALGMCPGDTRVLHRAWEQEMDIWRHQGPVCHSWARGWHWSQARGNSVPLPSPLPLTPGELRTNQEFLWYFNLEFSKTSLLESLLSSSDGALELCHSFFTDCILKGKIKSFSFQKENLSAQTPPLFGLS